MQIKELIEISITPEGRVSFVALQKLCSCFATKLGILDDNLDQYLSMIESDANRPQRISGGADVSESDVPNEPQTTTEQPSLAEEATSAEQQADTEQTSHASMTAKLAENEEPASVGTKETQIEHNTASELVPPEPAEQSTHQVPVAASPSNIERQSSLNQEESFSLDARVVFTKRTPPLKESPFMTASAAVRGSAESAELSPTAQNIRRTLSAAGSDIDWRLFGEVTTEQELFTLLQQRMHASDSSVSNLADIVMHARSIPQDNILLHRIRMCKAVDVIFVTVRELARHLVEEYKKQGREAEVAALKTLLHGLHDAAHMNYMQLNDDLNQLRRQQLAYTPSSSMFGSSEVLLEFQTGLFAKASERGQPPESNDNVWSSIHALRDSLMKICNKVNSFEHELQAKTLMEDRANMNTLLEKVERFERILHGEDKHADKHVQRMNELERKLKDLRSALEEHAQASLGRDEIMDLLNRKVEYQHLKNKVSRDEITLIQQLFEERVFELREIVSRNERNVMTVIDKLREVVVRNEADKWVQPLRNEIHEAIAELRDYLIEKFTAKDECKTLMARNTALHNVKCLACGTTCMMQSDMDETMPKLKQVHNTPTNAPVIAFELGNLRANDRMGYARANHLEVQVKPTMQPAQRPQCTKCPALHVNSVKGSCCSRPSVTHSKANNSGMSGCNAAKRVTLSNNNNNNNNSNTRNFPQSKNKQSADETTTVADSRESRLRRNLILQGTRAKY